MVPLERESVESSQLKSASVESKHGLTTQKHSRMGPTGHTGDEVKGWVANHLILSGSAESEWDNVKPTML